MNISFQPIVEIDTDAVIRAEAFCRMGVSLDGLDGTAEYIRHAEQNGLMRELTESVVDRALRERDGFEQGPALSVNLSHANLEEPDLCDRVERFLDRYEMEGSSLTFELNEGIEFLKEGRSMDALRRLSADGVRVSVDGFGPTLSMFSYIELERIGARELKIDAQFLSSIGASRRAVLAGIVALARTGKMDAVIKNVETTDQLALAKDLGCNCAQGYLIATPMDPAEMREWLAGHHVVPAARRSADQAPLAKPLQQSYLDKFFSRFAS